MVQILVSAGRMSSQIYGIVLASKASLNERELVGGPVSRWRRETRLQHRRDGFHDDSRAGGESRVAVLDLL